MVPKVVKFISLMIAGRWVTMHQQAKTIIKKWRILLPPFGPSESRAQIPVFRERARGQTHWSRGAIIFGSHFPKLVQEFRSRIDSEAHSGGFRKENIPEFLSPAILNALGLAAFNCDFLDD